MQSIAQAWLVLKLSNSSMALGVVAFAGYAPVVLVSLFAGVVVDHVDRRRLIVAAQSLLMLSAFVLAGLTWSGAVRVEHVLILAALNGLVSSFDMPGRQAFVVEMVGRDDLPNAIAMNSMIFNGARLVGPAVAGIIIGMAGVTACFFLNGVSYLAVIWSLLEMDVARREVGKRAPALLRRLREGVRYVWHHRPSRYLLILLAINSGFGMQYAVLLPLFARDLLHAGASGYGFLTAAQGVGALAGAVAINSRPSTPRTLQQNLAVGLLCSALAILMFGLSPWLALSLLAQVVVGAGMLLHMVTTNTMLQLFVSDELRGRVMSLYILSFTGTMPIGSLEVGWVGEYMGPRAAVAGCAMVSLVCAAWALIKRSALVEAGAGFEHRNFEVLDSAPPAV